MKRGILYGLWGFFWIISGLLGHNTDATGSQAVAITVVGLCTFVPGLLLLLEGLKHNRKDLLTVRWISLASLVLTAVFFVANILSVTASETAGLVLHEFLIFVSAPMMCMPFYPLSLFLWACLLFATFQKSNK
jgi:hypothetical protein